MGGTGKKIIIFMFALNIFLVLFGVGGDYNQILTGTGGTVGNVTNKGFGFTPICVSDTDPDPTCISGETITGYRTMNGKEAFEYFLPLLIAFAGIAIGMAIISQDLATGVRAGIAGFLIGLFYLPFSTISTLTNNVILQVLFGGVLVLMGLLALLDFVGGGDI